MNIVAEKDSAGTMTFTPDSATIQSGQSTVSITMVPPSGASWTITSVSSDPSATWTNNTADLPEGAFDITIEASAAGKSGTSTLRVIQGV